MNLKMPSKLRKFCECGKPISDNMDKCPDCIMSERPQFNLDDKRKGYKSPYNLNIGT
jgi:hypothetical protein